MYWVNSENDNIVTADKWTPGGRFELSNPELFGEGCVVAEIFVEHRYVVDTRLKKVGCGESEPVANFICEKTDADDRGI